MRCLSDSIFLELPARLVRRLLDLCRLSPDELQPGRRLDHGLSQGELAASIGVSRESVNKLLAGWKKDGWIDAGRGYVTVLRPSPLMRHASISFACVPTAGSVAARDASRTIARSQFPL
jgi:CRP/FNR family transcriptional regulator/CRP/FNR family cyclic AMP-dependent transcriptional regulator